jgi:hypothetical protein
MGDASSSGKIFNVVHLSCDSLNIHRFHHQLVDVCIYYTQVIQILAICPGHLQGVTSLVDMYSIWKLLIGSSHVTIGFEGYTLLPIVNLWVLQLVT